MWFKAYSLFKDIGVSGGLGLWRCDGFVLDQIQGLTAWDSLSEPR